MLSVYSQGPAGLTASVLAPGTAIPEDAVWLDLLEPTLEEERQVEQALGIDVPTREEMREIETSNRLYEDRGALYMTSTVLWKADTAVPETTQVTFILTGSRLVTNRYADLLAFKSFTAYAEKHPAACASPSLLLTGLLESIVNRIADVLERIGADIDATSLRVFPRAAGNRNTSPGLQGRAAEHRPERRADLQGARDAAQPHPAGGVPAAKHRRARQR